MKNWSWWRAQPTLPVKHSIAARMSSRGLSSHPPPGLLWKSQPKLKQTGDWNASLYFVQTDDLQAATVGLEVWNDPSQ